MDKETITLLYDYHCWATARVIDAARKAGDAAFIAERPNLPHGSLCALFVHTLFAEWIWRQRVAEGVSPSSSELNRQSFTNVDALADRLAQEQDAIRGFLASLDDDDLQKTVSYQNTHGQPFQNTLWHILAHLVNHGTQHRSEIAMTLTELNCSPGDLDMIQYFRELA